MKKTETQVRAVNSAFEEMSRKIRNFERVCFRNNSPIRGVTFKAQANGVTKLHVTYKSKSKL